MYGKKNSQEDEKEVEGTVLGGGGDEVSVMPVFYPRGMVSVSSLSFFILVVYHLNLLIYPFLSLSEYTVLKGISRIRGVRSGNTSIHRRRRPDICSRKIK